MGMRSSAPIPRVSRWYQPSDPKWNRAISIPSRKTSAVKSEPSLARVMIRGPYAPRLRLRDNPLKQPVMTRQVEDLPKDTDVAGNGPSDELAEIAR